jgi:hypothetical protein
MKNIHLIPTSQPSRLFYGANAKKLMLSSTAVSFKIFERSPQHIYITSDEKIKVGDYIIELDDNEVFCSKGVMSKNDWCKKIILTTDVDLIENGIQAIDDDFLEWFVNNPSCEFVELDVDLSKHNGQFQTKYGWKIITSQEEPKQETIEEAAEKMYKQSYDEFGAPTWDEGKLFHRKAGFIDGAKWQQERMYSEEDLLSAFKAGMMFIGEDKGSFREWFEQFKKK